MRRSLACLVLAVGLSLTACAGVRDSSTELPQQAGSIADQAQFCFSVTRTLQGVEAGSVNGEVTGAAEEVLAQAPDELRDHARTVAEALRQATRDGVSVLAEHERLDDAVEQLREGVHDMCEPRTTDPTSAGG